MKTIKQILEAKLTPRAKRAISNLYKPKGAPHIQNIRFWDLPIESLRFIVKDAQAAMKANPTARSAEKWADEVNDAATVMHWRKKKGIKEDIQEGMVPEVYLKDAENAAQWLDKEIKKMFKMPRWYAESRMGKILGPVFMVRIIFFGDNPHNDLNSLNSHRQLRLMMQFSNGSGEVVEKDKFQLEWSGHTRLPKNVKYRKITAKSPMEVAKKLVVWLKKNEANFKDGTELTTEANTLKFNSKQPDHFPPGHVAKGLKQAADKQREMVALLRARKKKGLGKKLKEEMKTFRQISTELEEARRGRKNVDADDMGPEADQNIMVQLKKAEDVKGNFTVTFASGEKKKLPLADIQKVLRGLAGVKPAQRQQLQDLVGKSFNDFKRVANAIRS